MPTPSLVNIPFITAPNVLFSQIPESGAGDFTVTRTTSPVVGRSTRVNAAGLIELVADNVARLDYPLGGAVNGCPALLVEPSAQNQMLQSQDLSLAFPSQNNTNPSANVSISPDGTQNADRLTFLTTGGYRLRNFSIVSGTSYTATLFYKNVDFTTGNIFSFQVSDGVVAAMRVNINPVTNTITQATGPFTNVSSSIENYGNGWYRVRISGTASNTGGGWYELVTNAAKSIDLWGFQFETGLVATSYILTTTAPVTRSADIVRKTNIASLIGQSEGTVYFEVEVTDEARDKWICTLDSSSSNYIQVWIDSVRRIRVLIVNAGSTVMTVLIPSASSVGYHKMAFAYNTATNGCEMFIDGVQNPVASRTVTGAGLPALNNFTLGSFTTSNSDSLKGRIRAAALYPNRLSNLRLEFLTAPVTYTTYAQMANALSYILP